jgi:peptidoglycan/LPS O-acetylase OafA/YrhL
VTDTVDPGKARRSAGGIPIVAAFDGYRALAVVGVVLFHVFEVCGVLAVAGDSAGGLLLWGVLPASLTVFFIVSGFVMFLPTAVRTGDFGSVPSFAIGRAARLLPPYWLTLLVAVLLLAAFGGLPGSGGLPGPGSVIGHLSMMQTPALLLDGPVILNGAFEGGFSLGFGVVAPVWTLSVETVFYLILPLIAASYFRRPFVGLLIAMGLVIGWHLIGLNIDGIGSAFGIDVSPATEARFHDYYASQFPNWALALAAGMTSAWLYVRLREWISPRRLEQRAGWVSVASAPAVALLIYLAGHEAISDPNPLNGLFARQSLGVALAYPLVLATAMLAFSLASKRVQAPLANVPVRGLADISYTIYLIHFAVIWFALRELSLPQTGSAWSAIAWSAVVFPSVLLYAYLSARFFERPIRRWANRYRRRMQRGPSPGVASVEPRVAGGAEIPPVSIVIPTYNRAQWLPGAIESVLAQDYPDLELVVIDDGSTDETAAVLAGYAERHPAERFRFLRQ